MELSETFVGINIYEAKNLEDFNINKQWLKNGQEGTLIKIYGTMDAKADLHPVSGGCKAVLGDYEIINIKRNYGAYLVRNLGLMGIVGQDRVSIKPFVGLHTRFQGSVLLEQVLEDGSFRKSYVPFDLDFLPISLFLIPGLEINNPIFFRKNISDKFRLKCFETKENTNLSPKQFELLSGRRYAKYLGLY
ncbi:MAG: hypothetical protein KC589_11430 [Nanoarchaeota archaeon]|nr:hypothetical protein [Nanoarchaeota archaeon]